MEKYAIENGKLIILDDELQIDLCSDFDLPKIGKSSKNQLIEKYENEKIKRASLLKNERLHGESIFYTEDGLVQGRCYYFEDKLHGPSVFFHNEKVLSECWFFFGNKEGKARRYYANNELYCLERYKNNLLCGEQNYFYPTKKLKSYLLYDKGHLLKAKLFFEDGSIKREIDTEKKVDKIYEAK